MTGEKWHNLKQENHVLWDHLERHEVLGSQSNTTDQQEWLLQNSKGPRSLSFVDAYIIACVESGVKTKRIVFFSKLLLLMEIVLKM